MKNLTLSLILSFLSVGAGLGSVAHAEKMDSETQNMVIDRLSDIIGTMDKKDSSWVPSNIRLADLLAERARLRFMNEIEASCKGCKGSVADRQKALEIYTQVLDKAKPEAQGTILFQMAHLYEIADQNEKSISLYQNILKEKKKTYAPEILTRTRTSLADLYFQKGQYKEALTQYQQALKDSGTQQKGLVFYRVAWCQFNIDKLKDGIKTLENLAANPNMLTKETPSGVVADSGFRDDVLRDLATFYSREQVTSKQIAQFQKLIPAGERKEMLFYFAGEVDRLGQKQAASEIYKAYLASPDLSKEEKLDGMVQLAQVNYDKGSGESIDNFAVAAQEFKDTKCSEDQKCTELQKRMRKYVTELHRSKKVKPDQNVLRAYEIYVKTFPEDSEMAILGAQVAEQLNQLDHSALLYSQAAASAKDEKYREMALLGEIDAAERTQNIQSKESAYKHYLELMPQGPKAYEVRYQMAHLSYDRKQYPQAADQFRTLALDSKGSSDLRKKSADLALDCLAIEKRDSDLEKWSSEFASVFPAYQKEFQQIYRKALNNQIVKTANSDKASQSDLRQAIDKIQTANMTGASESEKSLHYKNMSVLAQKTNDEKVLMTSLTGLLSLKSLPASEREETLAREVGVYEKKMDYKSAYRLAQQMKFPHSKPFDRELKLGTLADLGNLRPQKHYEAALRLGLRGPMEMSVRQRLVMLSSRPTAELKRQQPSMMRAPQILAETTLLVYARNHSQRGLENILNRRELAHQPAIQFIKKQFFYPQHSALDRKISAHHLDVRNDRAMGKSIQQRLHLLSETEKSLATAVGLKDFTAQVMALSTVQRENQRFTNDLLSTPMPKGLNAKEQVKYVAMLKQQAKPYLFKAKIAEQKLQDFWANQQKWQAIIADSDKSRSEVRPYLAQELKILANLAPNSQVRGKLEDALNRSAVSEKELMSARVTSREEKNL